MGLEKAGMYLGRLGAQTLAHKEHFSLFFLQLYFSKKYVEVAINDFAMYLTILK